MSEMPLKVKAIPKPRRRAVASAASRQPGASLRVIGDDRMPLAPVTTKAESPSV
jgi:hypothetical protein